MNENRVFLDTNILIYAYDASAGQKNRTAKELLVELWKSKTGMLSTQVLQEFFVSVTTKIQKPLSIEKTKLIIRDLLHWEVIINDETSILNAIDIHKKHQSSFWDAMILQAAVNRGARLLYTEDMTHGQVVQGVRIVNPFKEE
jgi:predicted nucleic acid-binding protein